MYKHKRFKGWKTRASIFIQQIAKRDFVEIKQSVSLAPKTYEEVDKEHGRLEIRRCFITDQISWLNGREEWKNLKTIAKIERVYIQRGKETKEIRHFIS